MKSNFHFDACDDAMPTWRYPDVTHQTEYIGEVVRLTIEVEMSKEASYLRDMERARKGVKNNLEGPDSDIDQIIRSVRENGWKVSNLLVKAFPPLADPALAEAVVAAVRDTSEPDVEAGPDQGDDEHAAPST